MNKIEYDRVVQEQDLWKLFSDSPDNPSETVLFFCQLKPLLKPMKFEDETRLYHLFEHSTVPAPPNSARWRATVTQKNLRHVANAMSKACQDVAVQYLGTNQKTTCHMSNPKEDTRVLDTDVKKRRGKPKPKVKNDSVDKIVTSYFALLTPEPFEYGGKTYEPRDVTVSPLILRGYTCPPGCGGCCPRFSLDYIQTEDDHHPKPYPLTMRVVEFDGRDVEVWSDIQDDHDGKKCRNLNLDDGRCNIHGFQPFSCDFELLRSIMGDKSPRDYFTQKLYGRGWAMMRVDGKRGALCEMTEPSPETIADVDRRLARLETWMKHFGLNPSRVRMIRDELPEIAKSGKAFSITERENLMRLEGDA